MKTKVKKLFSAVFFVSFVLVLALNTPVHAKSKTIEIVLSTYWPTSYEYLLVPLINFTKNVEKESNGRVKF